MATQPPEGPADNGGMSGYDRRRATNGDAPGAGSSPVGTPGRRTLTGGALPRTTRDLPATAPQALVLQSTDARLNGRPVTEIDAELRDQLVALARGSTRIMEGLLVQKRMMQDTYRSSFREVVAEGVGDHRADPHNLDGVIVEWQALLGRINGDLGSAGGASHLQALAVRVSGDLTTFASLGQRTSIITEQFREHEEENTRALARLVKAIDVTKELAFTGAIALAVPVAAPETAGYSILGRAGAGIGGGALVGAGLHAADRSDPRSLLDRTLAGGEEGAMMGTSAGAGEAVGSVAKDLVAPFADAVPGGRAIAAAITGATETATAAGTYAAGATLANGGDLSAAATAGIEAAELGAPLGALMGVATAGLEPAAGRSNQEAAAIATAESKDSVDEFVIGPAPKSGPERWKYLEDPAHWKPERRALHEQLLADAKAEAQKFADLQADQGGPPTIYAMRGNTAVGKSRTAKNDIGELQAAVKGTGDMRSVNPDNFKVRLMTADGRSFTSAQVHSESSMLASRLERELAGIKTSKGDVGSLMIDKRLATVEDVLHYAKMAKETGRRLALYDVDAPLDVSLAGVLERVPGGPDPLPDFNVVGQGFDSVRSNRAAVMHVFESDPTLGAYELYATLPSGGRILVAKVMNGATDIVQPELLVELTAEPGQAAALAANKIIDADAIDQLTRKLDPTRAIAVRKTLTKYLGRTWKEALDAHSAERPGAQNVEGMP